MNKASGIIALLFLTAILISFFLVTPLKLPFDIPSQPLTTIKTHCSNIPTPLHDLNFFSVYDQSEKTRSRIDIKAQALYKKSVKPINDFESFVISHANHYLKTRQSSYASCTLDALAQWADHDALLDNANDQGIAVRKWALASMASAYAQISSDRYLEKAKKKDVEDWLEKIAYRVMSDYSHQTSKRSRQNNHLYWAGWAVGMTGAAIDKRTLFVWGIQQGRKGIAAINDNGTLDHELARGSRALHYHLYAETALTMLDRLARSNNIQLDHQKLFKLRKLNDRALKTPKIFEELNGHAQDYEEKKTYQNRVGGDTTLLYQSVIVR